MSEKSSTTESIIYDTEKNSLKILNQLLLPIDVIYEPVNGVDDAWQAIKLMKVRGAPAIAILGMLSVSIELGCSNVIESLKDDVHQLKKFIKLKGDHLCSSRPTAVNIRKEFDRLDELLVEKVSEKLAFSDLVEWVRQYCYDMLELDRQTNRKIGDFGADHIIKRCQSSFKLNVLTHCNTGSLATAGYGTALGVIRSLNSRGVLQRAFCTETRPYNQGARLTAWELSTESIPSTLVCDDMVAWLMETKRIDAVVVGADRVVANGDTANKIGTFQIAILCERFGIPFYVASPLSTLDLSTPSGSGIPIEERPDKEMKFVGNVQIAPINMHCWNPAFDVTPAKLITGGIITENGVVEPKHLIQRFG